MEKENIDDLLEELSSLWTPRGDGEEGGGDGRSRQTPPVGGGVLPGGGTPGRGTPGGGRGPTHHPRASSRFPRGSDLLGNRERIMKMREKSRAFRPVNNC